MNRALTAAALSDPERAEWGAPGDGEALPRIEPAARRRLNLDPDELKNGLGQLVLTLIKLLHELMEKQAIRRMEAGALNEAQCERLGFTLMKQSEEIERLRCAFGLSPEDLNLDLGPLGKLI